MILRFRALNIDTPGYVIYCKNCTAFISIFPCQNQIVAHVAEESKIVFYIIPFPTRTRITLYISIFTPLNQIFAIIRTELLVKIHVRIWKVCTLFAESRDPDITCIVCLSTIRIFACRACLTWPAIWPRIPLVTKTIHTSCWGHAVQGALFFS